MRYPIGLQSFDHLREEGYVYVDKTAMVYSLAHGSTVYFWVVPDDSERVFLSLPSRTIS